MRYFLLLSLFACEDTLPKISGEKDILMFSTKTKNNFGDYWNPTLPLATHSQFNIYVRGWQVEYQDLATIEKKQSAYQPFLERYNSQDIETVKKNLKFENFIFDTELQVISTETTHASMNHRGSIELLSNQTGRFSIEAKGIDSDLIHVEVADADFWKAGVARKSILSSGYIESDYHEKICFYGAGSADFFYGFYDNKKRYLFGQFPNIELTSTSDSVSVSHKENIFSLNVKEELTEDIDITLKVKNVFGEEVISDLPPIKICPVLKNSITEITIERWLSETPEVEFQAFSVDELKSYNNEFKKTKRGSSLRKFLKEARKNEGFAWTSFIPEARGVNPTVNVPITVQPEEGLVFKAQDVFNEVDSDNISTLSKYSQPSITVTAGTPVLIVYPHKRAYKVSLKTMDFEKQIVIPPKKEDKKKEQEE